MLPKHLVRTVNPNGGVVYGRAMEEQFSNTTQPRPGNLDETLCADPHAGCRGESGRKTCLYPISPFPLLSVCYFRIIFNT